MKRFGLPLLLLLVAWLAAPSHAKNLATLEEIPSFAKPELRSFRRSEQRENCANFDTLRRPHFGDLHVHTGLSQDAATQGTRTTPAEAYRFARGESLGIQPFDSQGLARRSVRLDRPLDFAAVTDHAEFLGELEICTTPGLAGYDSWWCKLQRNFPRAAFFAMNTLGPNRRNPERFGMCGDEGEHCAAAAQGVWQLIQDAAEEAYDRSEACSFTSFVGYEWTASTMSNNLHRNVIFRNAEVPRVPTSYFEAPVAEKLHDALRRDCLRQNSSCDVVVIPHNSNLSGGLMFDLPASETETEESARARAKIEPLVEVMQHKGDSECLPGGFASDEECGFEKLEYSNFAGKFFSPLRWPPERKGFVRAALGEGLAIHQALGANPFRFGLIGSTDTHLGTPGLVSERDYPGHGGAGTPAGSDLPQGLSDDLEFNPGGLAVLWAEENSRDALFAAMRRREAYATSGPRLVVRSFGGWNLPTGLCRSHSFAATGYALGVPMGGQLAQQPEGSAGEAPNIAVWAEADPGSQSGAALERVQVVKGWLEDGEPREKVFDVAKAKSAPHAVDEDSCEIDRPAAATLCTVWQDPEFQANQAAYYYVRVLEQPTCRWSQYLCNSAGVDCSNATTVGEGLEGCCASNHQRSIRERAWTSPIWYQPPPLR